MNATVAILAAAVGVGFGHAILPDHWVPLAVLGRTKRYPLSTIARLSSLAGLAHVLLSIVLGAIVIVIGLQFRGSVESAQDTIVGGLLLATGVGFAAAQALGRGHRHGPSGHTHGPGGHTHGPAGHTHGPPEHTHLHDQQEHEHHGHGEQSHAHGPELPVEGRGWRRVSAVMVPFGAAASPDLTILPVFLAAAAAGVATAISSVVLFAAATIGTITILTLIAAASGSQIRGQWLERWGNAVTGLVLVVIGALVLCGVI